MRTFLDAVSVDGIKTNIPALKGALDTEAFRTGSYDTGLLEK
jgi:biotin carboxylase